MELFLIRHAQSANNAKPEAERVADPPLTGLGQQQANYLAVWVKSLKLTKLITSPFLRTLQTADRICAETGLKPEVRIQLHEQGGCYDGLLATKRVGRPGLTRAEIGRAFPRFDVEAELDGEGWWQSRPYESREQASIRAQLLLERTREEFARSTARVGYVMHADIKLLLLENVHAEPLAVPFNASVTKLSITPDEAVLVEYNRVEHMPARFVTY